MKPWKILLSIVCIMLIAVTSHPAIAALTPVQQVTATWNFKTASGSNGAFTDLVTVGLGPEISCPGNFQFCKGVGSQTAWDIDNSNSTIRYQQVGSGGFGGSGTWSFTLFDSSGRPILPRSFNLSTNISGLDRSRINITTNTVSIDMSNTGGGNVFFDLELSETSCPSILSNVLLPAIPSTDAGSLFFYRSNALGLNFTSIDAGSERGVVCKYQSNSGVLGVFLEPPGLSLHGRSETQAIVTIFKSFSSAVPFLQDWDFSQIINNGRLLNGPLDPSHAYLRWESRGFLIQPLNFQFPLFSDIHIPGPLTYWVDLTKLNLAPESNSVERVIRGAEARLHEDLSNLVIVKTISLGVAVDVTPFTQVFRSGLTFARASGPLLGFGYIEVKNTSTHTISGPIQILLINLTPGIELSPRSGLFRSAIPYISSSIPSLVPGVSTSMSVRFVLPPANSRRLNYDIRVYSGRF
jgi:hypothetical protein